MSFPYRERRFLRHSAKTLRAADPHLATMFAAFAKVAAHEALPAHEQITERPRAVRVIAAMVIVLASLVAGAVSLAGRGGWRAARGCVAAGRLLRRHLPGTHRHRPARSRRTGLPQGPGISLKNQ